MNTPTNLPSDFEGTNKSQPAVHKFEFTGNAGDMWPIILKNFIFNILTLSLYRFWGRTNVRRYLWANTRIMGDPFEYTGKGGEMFMGFVVVFFAVFLPLGALLMWAQSLIVSGSGPLGITIFLVTYFFMLWLLPLGLYRAYKYRMSRTRWRGIRGGQKGSGVAYAFDAFSFAILSLFTLGMLVPLMENKLWARETNNRTFGTGSFHFEGGSGPLYKSYFVMLGLYLAGLVGFVLIAGLSGALGKAGVDFSLGKILGLVLGYIVLGFFGGIGFVVFAHKKLNHFWNNSTFKNIDGELVSFNFSGDLREMIDLFIGNFFLILITLGLAFPITQMRVVRYLVTNLSMEGNLDLAAISQSSEAEPSFGEGLAEGFDMGTI